MFMTKVSKERRIPFEVTADPFYSEANVKHLQRVINQYEAGKTQATSHDLIEV
jgi:DNA-damage-inducible protein J